MAKTTRPGAPTSAQKRLSAQRAAAARERIQAAQRRRRLIAVGAALGAVLVVVAILVAVKVATGGNKPKSGVKATRAAVTVAQRIAAVPASVFNTVGTGSNTVPPKSTNGTALTGDGKPRVLYVGAEYCPFCAAERWPLAVALSRFGTLHNLGQVRSSPSDVYPNTATLSFHGVTYTSPYLAFTGKELQTNQVSGGQYTALDTISGTDKTLFEKNGSSYPFLDIGGTSIVNQAEYDPKVLKGKTQQQIAAALSDPTSAIAEGVIGSANRITANLCKLTGDKPAPVCTSAGVLAAARA